MPRSEDIPNPGAPVEQPTETIEREVNEVRARIERALRQEFQILRPEELVWLDHSPSMTFIYGTTPIRVDVWGDPHV